MDDWYLTVALILVGCGAVLLVAEMFLPTGGLAVVTGVVFIAVAVGLILLYGTTQEAVVSVLGISIGLPIAGALMFSAWKRISLQPTFDADTGTVAGVPEVAEMDRLKGRFGRTVTPMRPSGAVEIDGRRIDAMSEGPMIDPGEWVKCIDVRAGKVLVRRVDAPADLSDMPIDDLM